MGIVQKEEDYRFYGTITTRSRQIADVPCKVFLPEKHDDEIRVVCPLNEQQFLQASGISRFSLAGMLTNSSGQKQGEITAKILWVESLSESHKDGLPPDRTLYAYTFELTVTHFFESSPKSQKTSTAIFWISPNSLLEPIKHFRPYANGAVRVKVLRKRDLRVHHRNITFDLVSQYKGGDHEVHVSRQLVAKVESQNGHTPASTSGLIQAIDDLVLIASFAARHRTACYRWDLEESGSIATHYRSRTLGTQKQGKRFFPDVLIEYNQLLPFLKKAISRLEREGALANLLRRSMHVLTKEPHVIEHDYIALFSALETLVLYFRKKHGFGFILKENHWKQIHKTIRDALKKADVDKKRSKLLLGNLIGANRMPLNDAFVKMCKRYKVDVTDLWPFSGAKGSLINIRNRLAHGEPLADVQAGAAMIATRHLQWITERVLLRVLDWPIERSGVDKYHLVQWIPYHDWQARLREFEN